MSRVLREILRGVSDANQTNYPKGKYMSVKKKVAFTAFAVAVSLIACGCGKALVLENAIFSTVKK